MTAFVDAQSAPPRLTVPVPFPDSFRSHVVSLTTSDVEHVAQLARLGLSDEETELMREQLSSILGHIAVLQQLDTDHIPPTAQVNNLTNVLRDDAVRPSLSQDAALANAPMSRNGFIEVRAVLGGEGNEGGSA
jgi:aspartyl-tRNA(Asn)/glutamyl-tRNA(Gln) amidotransferase subunit C